MSPELGVRNGKSDLFFIEDKNVLKDVIVENGKWVFSAISKVNSRLQISALQGTFYAVSFGDGNRTV
jgi:hypothetical protein